MSTLLDINTMRVYYNVSIPTDTTGWVVDPDLSSVSGVDPMFWYINPDNSITIMTETQQDTAYLASSIVTAQAAVDDQRDSILYGGINYNGDLYDTDTQSIANIIGTQTLINAGVTL